MIAVTLFIASLPLEGAFDAQTAINGYAALVATAMLGVLWKLYNGQRAMEQKFYGDPRDSKDGGIIGQVRDVTTELGRVSEAIAAHDRWEREWRPDFEARQKKHTDDITASVLTLGERITELAERREKPRQ